MWSNPESRRLPSEREGKGNPLQQALLKNLTDRGALAGLQSMCDEQRQTWLGYQTMNTSGISHSQRADITQFYSPAGWCAAEAGFLPALQGEHSSCAREHPSTFEKSILPGTSRICPKAGTRHHKLLFWLTLDLCVRTEDERGKQRFQTASVAPLWSISVMVVKFRAALARLTKF